MPGWEVRAFGFEIPNPFFPGVLLATVTFGLLYTWPFLERRFSHDDAVHHLVDRPRDRPLRTALGVATLVFYGILTFAAASDVLSTTFGLSVNFVLWAFRILLFTLPPVVAFGAFRLCQELQAAG
jgi:ubiquinol-cytochrome c reductase cytochrome b subunit